MAEFRSAVLACKIAELVLACATIGLHFCSSPKLTNDAAMVVISLGSYTIIVSGVLLGNLIGEMIPWKIELFFTGAGILISVAAGDVAERLFIDCIYNHHARAIDVLMISGPWLIVIILFIDSVMIYMNVPKEKPVPIINILPSVHSA